MKKLAVWSMFAVMFFAVLAAGCGGGNSPDSEQTESLNNDSGSYDPNEEARGNSETTVDLSTLTADYIVQDGYILTGTLRANVKVTIAHGAAVTLKDATIKGVDDNKYRWAGIICAGDATLILKGTNTVRGFYNIYPSIYVPVGRNLTIKGEGSLEASSNGLAAGIGGEYDNACGNIIIDGGTITATGGRNAAGIGGAYYGDCGNITINGGTITAKGSIHAADIGGGYSGKCGNITINGGTIIATGSAHAAGIGAGYSGKCGDITINSGNVTANGSDNAAGIGGGYSGKCGNITINDGNVTATGSNYAAGIGGGRHGDCGDILIDGGTVNATGGKRSAGIGGGEDSRCASVTISNNVISVTATKGNEATHSVGDGFFVGCRVTIGGVEEKKHREYLHICSRQPVKAHGQLHLAG